MRIPFLDRYVGDQLPDDILHRIEERTRPGAMSASGFLAPGEILNDVIARDAEAVRAIGVRITAIGLRIDAILSNAHARGRRIGASALSVGGRFLIYGMDEVSTGRQECPFLDRRGRPCSNWGSQDYEIANRASGLRFGVTGLAPHLILEHRFFEGSVPYRIDPRLAARVLELLPDVRPSS